MPELEPSAWLAEEWARQLSRVLESMVGEPANIAYVPHELAPAEIDSSNDGFFWWEQHFTSIPNAPVWIGAAAETWREIGARVLRSAGIEEIDTESIRSTYSEIINQALSGVAGALSTRARKEISCAEGRATPPAPSAPATARSFEITLGEMALPMLAVFSNSLGKSDSPQQPAPAPAPAPKTANALESQNFSSIELLLDVELPVSISFGRAQLALKDVIKLTTGSIVELNRALSEPVEVIVNNCVIARGEVVVVEGNYGIRIKNVVSRQERLRTLI